MIDLTRTGFLCLLTILASTIVCETIHFTNSQNHLINKNNFTTYKLNVPGSDPITIIEGNPNKNNGISNLTKKMKSRILDTQHNDTNIDMSSVSVTIDDPKTSREESVSRDTFMSQKKTVYSPELLKKFLKDYTEKFSNEETSFQDKLNEIIKLNYQQMSMDLVESEDEGKLEEKYGGNYDTRRPSPNPYNDKEGWVTLDAIPWSTSKVSKWHSNPNMNNNYNNNNNKYNNNKHNYAHISSTSSNSPNWPEDNDQSPQEYPRPQRPPYFESSSTNEDDYFDSRPGYHSTKPWNNDQKPNYEEERPNYNRPRPTTEYYSHKPSHFGSSQSAPHQSQSQSQYDSWYDQKYQLSNNNEGSYKPWNEEIMTDGHSPNFPRLPLKKPASSSDKSHYQYLNMRPNSMNSHPPSHPANGNGEWVLISTTKGYHLPRHGQRAMAFQPSNNMSSHQTVKLTVLPGNSISPEGNPHNFNTTISHGGLLEVESSFQSVEDNQKQQAFAEKLNTTKRYTTKHRFLKSVPLASRNAGQDSSAVLAAVGAGIIPAAAAMLMPIMLGRKKRENNQSNVTFVPSKDYKRFIQRNLGDGI